MGSGKNRNLQAQSQRRKAKVQSKRLWQITAISNNRRPRVACFTSTLNPVKPKHSATSGIGIFMVCHSNTSIRLFSICLMVCFIILAAKHPNSFQIRLHQSFNISASASGSQTPFLHSNSTVPDSFAQTLCHCPAGTFTATLGPLGVSSIDSVHIRSSSS